MQHRRKFRLLLLTDGTTEHREFKFTNIKVIALGMVALLFLGAMTYGASRLMANYFTKVAMTEVMNENLELRQNIDWLTVRIDEVGDQLSVLASSDDQLRVMADMPRIDEDTRQMGIGGAVVSEFSRGGANDDLSDLIFDLEKIKREIRLQRTSFSEISRQLDEREDLLRHTPSIYPTQAGYMSSKFGRRKDPFNGRWTHHNGIDISTERGTPVYSTADGKVVHAKKVHGLGNLVVIDHGYGFKTAYGHMDRYIVRNGQSVSRGEKIGEVGNTGRSTAPHLHYEVHVDRKSVDPRDYFFEGYAAIP